MRMYQNPICKRGDFADPFVLRHQGRYYLYCTNPGVLCWSSADLLTWRKEGSVVPEEEFPGLVPFAPEVVYHNGSFYMYTSPHGLGHYVLKSASPLGPFRKITPNIGHNIDFSVFVDEDGRWYAYWADEGAIMGCEMHAPDEFGLPHPVGVTLHGWTEGPFVVKQDGIYHLTYTGNHYLSKGYRINEAVSLHPLEGYRDNPRNPLIVRTEGEVVGLGHSSMVLGPDLLSHYIVYHNLNPDRSRDLNIDRILMGTEGSVVLGPTDTPQPAPALPMFSDTFDNEDDGRWTVTQGSWHAENGMRVSTGRFFCQCMTDLPTHGAAECHLCQPDGATGAYGLALLAEGKRITLGLHPMEGCITLTGESIRPVEMRLPPDFRHDVPHALRLVFGDTLTVHLDALLVGTVDWRTGGATLAYWAEDGLRMGYTAFSDAGQDELFYPIPCALPNIGAFSLNVPADGCYTLVLALGTTVPERLLVDGSLVAVAQARQTGSMGTITLPLPKGLHTLASENCAFDAIYTACETKEHTFVVRHFGPDAKHCEGGVYDDIAVRAELTLGDCAAGWQAGVLLRATELADGGEGNDPVLGRNFFIGYRVAVDAEGLSLWKHRYDETLLARVPVHVGRQYALSAEISLNRIRVWIDGVSQIEFTDPEPILCGHAGFHVRGCVMETGTLAVNANILPADNLSNICGTKGGR